MERKRKPLSQIALGDQIPDKRQKSCVSNGNSIKTVAKIEQRAGVVTRMILKNFMCHSHLEVTLSSNMNYIIGRNGSGKSAILTALVVGLGGKASVTNRGTSIKGFIKAGKKSATVEITLNNKGYMAYRQTVFGNEITIVRHFLASGGGTYKIKSATGETISTQVKEVQQICSAFNIQIDNPVCLLNQDTSRNFLNTKDPRQKFVLFMRATQLETLFEEYRKMFTNKKCAIRVLNDKEQLLQKLENELKQLKHKVENYRSIIGLRVTVTNLQRELFWSKVRDSEEENATETEAVNRLEQEKNVVSTQIDNVNQNNACIRQATEALQNQLAELGNSIEEQNGPQNAIVRCLGELKESHNVKQREKRVVLKDIAMKTGNCSILEQEIAKTTENFKQLEQEKMERLEEISKLEEKMRGIVGLLETSKNDQFQMRNSLNRLKEEEYALGSELKQNYSQIQKTGSRLNGFKSESSNVLSLYGRDMITIVEAINAAKNKFTHVPRGPLGSYIQLKDKKWAVAVEGFIGPGMLRSFTVDNKNDNKILMDILNKFWKSGNKPMVITSKFFFQVHDVRQNLVQRTEGCLSVYEALEISDPVVANCLIDQLSLESTLLIPTTNQAIELMSDQSRVPRNCRQGIMINGDKYYPDPNYKTYCSRYHNSQFLQVSTAEMISQLERQLQELNDQKITITNQRNSIQTDMENQMRQIQDLEIKITKLNRAQLHIKRQYDDLKNLVDPEVANVRSMETELEQLKELIEQRTVVSQKIEAGLVEIKNEISQKEEQLDRIKIIVRGYEDRMEPLQHQIREHVTRQKEFDVNKRFAMNRLNDFNLLIAAARSKLLKKQSELENYLQQATKTGERPVQLRLVNVIMEELKVNERAIAQIEADVDSPAEVFQKYENCNDKYTQVSLLMQTMRENVTELHRAAEKRKRCYKSTEDYFITFIKHSFQKVLEFRQFSGSIEIDMDEKKLDLIVIPQQGSQGYTTTTNLSGGERSFSTVAFLYALWQCMEFPFYFMDEFDVFMDKVNRAKVMDILFYHAKCHPDLQFVFLTPQDISFVNNKAVAIHRLEDPERGIINGD